VQLVRLSLSQKRDLDRDLLNCVLAQLCAEHRSTEVSSVLALGAIVGFSQQAAMVDQELLQGQLLPKITPDSLSERGLVELTSLILALANLGIEEQELTFQLYALLSKHTPSMQSKHVANVLLALATSDVFPNNLLAELESKLKADIRDNVFYEMDDALTICWALASLEYYDASITAPLLERFVCPNMKLRKLLNSNQQNQLHQVALAWEDRRQSDKDVFKLFSPDLWNLVYQPKLCVGELPEVRTVMDLDILNLDNVETAVETYFRDREAASSKEAPSSAAETIPRLRSVEQNVQLLDDFYGVDLLVTLEHGGNENTKTTAVILDCALSSNDPWQRIKKRQLRAAGYEIPDVRYAEWELLQKGDKEIFDAIFE